jgi:hypothetical protein
LPAALTPEANTSVRGAALYTYICFIQWNIFHVAIVLFLYKQHLGLSCERLHMAGLDDCSIVQPEHLVLAVLKPKRIIRKRTDANCNSFHLRVFLGLSNKQGQRQTSTLYIPYDNFGERKAKFNLETSRITQMQLYKCIHVS